LVSSVTSQTFGGYLSVLRTQLNKQQLTTASFGKAKLEGYWADSGNSE